MPELTIGKNIRRLRLVKEMTQEELAERVGVTGQAVSRWERGECCPDITLLPGLANLFGVTTDELLGMEEINDSARRWNVHAQASVLAREGKYREGIALYEQAIKLWPDEYSAMSGLAQLLVLAEGTKHIRRAVSLMECALQNSANEKHRCTARATLCYMYRMAGEPQKAYELARNTGHCIESRELLWPEFMEPLEREAYLKENMPRLLRRIQALMDGKTMADEEGIRLICVGE